MNTVKYRVIYLNNEHLRNANIFCYNIGRSSQTFMSIIFVDISLLALCWS